MKANWARFDRTVRDLIASVDQDSADDVVGEPAWLALDRPLPPHIRRAAESVPATPAILWDLDALAQHATWLSEAFRAGGIELNLAMKACATPAVLSCLAGLGFGCDVASRYELAVAQRQRFREVSACGPSFRPHDALELHCARVLLDVTSMAQARDFTGAPGVEALGLRLRVPLPARLESPTSRGRASRFGVPLTETVAAELVASPVDFHRLRVHTGESTSATLCFRALFAVAVAELLDGVRTINLGGGFLRLARRPEALLETLARLAKALASVLGPAHGYRFTAEPGGALVVDHAYLVTDVIEVDEHPTRRRLVTVDGSAWNVGPWSKTTFHTLRETGEPAATMVVGPSLYELDAFSHRADHDRHTFQLGRCVAGDRLVGTSFGAYTMTNGRSFNGFPLPAEYSYSDGTVELLRGPRSFTEPTPHRAEPVSG